MMAYERLEAWRRAHRLAIAVFAATDVWPRSERYELTAQIRRAALSVPTKVAEGAAKRGGREFGRYLNIALGSLAELSYLLRFAHDRQLLSDEEWATLEGQRDCVGRLVYGLYRKVRPPPVRPPV
jgi:four helix bundle protein